MSGRAGRGKSCGKKKEVVTYREMLQMKERWEKDVKSLNEKMKEDLKKERERHRKEIQYIKRQFAHKFVDQRRDLNEKVAFLQEIADTVRRQLEESEASNGLELHSLYTNLTNFRANANEEIERERRRQNELTRRVRRREVDFRDLASIIRR